jgi:hypothetical protein
MGALDLSNNADLRRIGGLRGGWESVDAVDPGRRDDTFAAPISDTCIGARQSGSGTESELVAGIFDCSTAHSLNRPVLRGN